VRLLGLLVLAAVALGACTSPEVAPKAPGPSSAPILASAGSRVATGATAVVTGPGNGVAPTGTISWKITGPTGGHPKCAPTPLVDLGTTPPSSSATCSFTIDKPGRVKVTVAYSGDVDYNPVSKVVGSWTVTAPGDHRLEVAA
jgi:hypothetical protein